MASRTEFERPIFVAGEPARLYASCGHWDDYLEVELPDGVEWGPVIARRLQREFGEAQDTPLDVRLRAGPPLTICILAQYVGQPEERDRDARERLTSILLELERAAPDLDFGDLLPDHLRTAANEDDLSLPLPADNPIPPAVTDLSQVSVAPSSVIEVVSSPVVTDYRQAEEETSDLAADAARAEAAARALGQARAFVARGQTHKAFRSLDEALRFNPSLVEARLLQQNLRTLEHREKRRQKEPRNAQAHLEAGFSYLMLDCDRAAAAALEQAGRLGPNIHLTQVLLGIALHREGQVAAARAAYKRAIRLQSKDDDDVASNLLAALEAGEPPPPIGEADLTRPASPNRTAKPSWVYGAAGV